QIIHAELRGREAREAFTELIGGAIQQGIEEVQDILTALSALIEGVNNDISTIQQIIVDRLVAFIDQSE
ncbi:MAG: DUF5610 domain-containing protein, partial [Candidatus Hydrogenedentota bacterium]